MAMVHLKVKIKSLAEEARIIRKEEDKRRVFLHGDNNFRHPEFLDDHQLERKQTAAARRIANKLRASKMDKGLRTKIIDERQSLSDHRRWAVRREARHSLLAYGYLRGRKYKQMEAKCWSQPDWRAVEDMVKRFGGKGRNDIDLKAWREE